MGAGMTAGQNRDFASFLDELLAEAAEPEQGAPRINLDYLSVVDELHSGRINFTDEKAAAEYRANASEKAVGSPAAETAAAPSVDPDEIARELDLARRAASTDLDRLRREFAFRNHPDRVPEHLRARAMIRMQVANTLIDEAKRRRFRPKKT
ncbi:hypothetical protein NTH_03756 [Nitratireductor thuwali]|uniref:Molecular chaperone DnaJ n=2 Tax=Nitratireductor thuwali TaxID=2267699 RepID=A0ABY5MPQ1_9HYPH|nr:hypothetical protein NTH_03756 [Nitratireductor thuwali]